MPTDTVDDFFIYLSIQRMCVCLDATTQETLLMMDRMWHD